MPRNVKRAMWWISIPVTLYAALCGVVYCNQAALLYFPGPDTGARPTIPYTDLTLETPDHAHVNAWAVPAADTAPWVIFCHGNAGTISGRVDTVNAFHALNANILIFDYRGYGKSTGTPSEAGLYADALTCYTWLTETHHVAPDRIVVYGESLGGGVASWLASEKPVAGLVLQSTFTSVPDVGARVYPWLPVKLLSRHRFPSLTRIPRITAPKLIMHSPQDELIPYAFGRQLYDAAADPRTFVELTGAHNTPLSLQSPQVRDVLKQFLYDCAVKRRPAK